MSIFSRADIWLPASKWLANWPVVACDQYSAQPEYWEAVAQRVGNDPSALHLILPEAYLGQPDEEERIQQIYAAMQQYLENGILNLYPHSYIYVERTLDSGIVRRGLIGKIDLECYEYTDVSEAPIRCTEKTVVERIPARRHVREGAVLEMPHILLLCNDETRSVIEPFTWQKADMEPLYDVTLGERGGRVCGWLVPEAQAQAFDQRMHAFEQRVRQQFGEQKAPAVLAVGDGNHSLAAAKAWYEKLKEEHPEQDFSQHPARYALVELENLQDEAQRFEPIHRLVSRVDAAALLQALENECGMKQEKAGHCLRWISGEKSGAIQLDPRLGELAVGVLQSFLDRYTAKYGGEMEYIHGEEALRQLALKQNSIGFLLPPFNKNALFRAITLDGALPRKTFSMGHAWDKRYYLEMRKIR